MTDTSIIELAMRTMMVALKLSAPILVTSLVIGFTVFSEVPRHSPLFLLIEVGALGCMAAGLWMLIRFEEAHQHEDAQPEPARD